MQKTDTILMHQKIYKSLHALRLLAIVFLFVQITGNTQETSSSHDLLTKLYSCSQIEQLEAQNDCYAQASTALEAAEEAGEILIIRKQGFQEMQEGVFGYKNDLIEKYTTAEASQLQKLNSISVPVKKVERYLSGYVVSLDNNQVWEQFAGNIPRVPRGKLTAQINLTPTGNYKMVLFNDKSRVSNIRVRRIK